MGNSFISLYHNVFQTQSFPKELNKTYLCPIPKSHNANDLKSILPIRLYYTIYKVIKNIIANRIKLFLQNIICPYKTSFIKNRRANDNAIIIQELFQHLNNMKGKKANMIIKLNLEKVFDLLEWSFIYRTLKFFKFSSSIIKLISTALPQAVLQY